MTLKTALKRIRIWKKKKNPRKWLDLSCLDLTELPSLPSNVRRLNCSRNNLREFTNLPKRLKRLRCCRTNLETLRGLPTSLVSLDCRANYKLTSLDDAPDSIEFIDASHCEYIQTIKRLPQNLELFIFWYASRLKHIEWFPPNLSFIAIGETCLDKLPDLPKSLKILSFEYTHISYPPPLHEGLEELWISSNNLCTLPPLPKSLVILDISCNYKLELPIDLPPNIKFFDCVDDSLCINNYRIVL